MAVYDRFATEYSDVMGDKGDYFHRTQIDPYVMEILGEVKNKKIYDLGCGNGYLARKLAQAGAEVWASDVSEKLVEIAKARKGSERIKYAVHDGTDFLMYREGQFDAVVMNMVVGYIKELDKLMQGVAKVLKKGGKLVFSMPHFFRPMYPYSEWVKGSLDEKEILFIRVTGYLKEEARKAESVYGSVAAKLTLYNRPLGRYVEAMAQHGLHIFQIAEPESRGFAMQFTDKLQKSHHIPTFLIVGAKKF